MSITPPSWTAKFPSSYIVSAPGRVYLQSRAGLVERDMKSETGRPLRNRAVLNKRHADDNAEKQGADEDGRDGDRLELDEEEAAFALRLLGQVADDDHHRARGDGHARTGREQHESDDRGCDNGDAKQHQALDAAVNSLPTRDIPHQECRRKQVIITPGTLSR